MFSPHRQPLPNEHQAPPTGAWGLLPLAKRVRALQVSSSGGTAKRAHANGGSLLRGKFSSTNSIDVMRLDQTLGQSRHVASRSRRTAALAGFGELGMKGEPAQRRITASAGVRYRYYVSQPSVHGEARTARLGSVSRVPASVQIKPQTPSKLPSPFRAQIEAKVFELSAPFSVAIPQALNIDGQ